MLLALGGPLAVGEGEAGQGCLWSVAVPTEPLVFQGWSHGAFCTKPLQSLLGYWHQPGDCEDLTPKPDGAEPSPSAPDTSLSEGKSGQLVGNAWLTRAEPGLVQGSSLSVRAEAWPRVLNPPEA